MCGLVAEAIGDSGKVLDVGCGFGILVPYLKKAGVSEPQIVGNLLPEMIRNAQSFRPACTFEAAIINLKRSPLWCHYVLFDAAWSTPHVQGFGQGTHFIEWR
jgi:trans-aconitate methyltransferase